MNRPLVMQHLTFDIAISLWWSFSKISSNDFKMILIPLNAFPSTGKFRREFKNAFTCMCFRTKQPSAICRNSHHQTTKILNRQPVSNRIRANPQQFVEQTSQSFTNNPMVNFGTYLNQSTPSTGDRQAVLNSAIISQVEMPALRDWERSKIVRKLLELKILEREREFFHCRGL